MKLKSMMYALVCGKNRQQLVRSEGARRVKQAERMAKVRRQYKAATFGERYGMSSSQLSQSLRDINVEQANHVLQYDMAKAEALLSNYLIGATGGKDSAAMMNLLSEGYKEIH